MMKGVVDKVGEDAVATVVYLYLDELARTIGKSVSDFKSVRELIDAVMSELGDEDGTIDGSILNCVEERVYARFRQEWGWLLPEPHWSEVNEAIYSLWS